MKTRIYLWLLNYPKLYSIFGRFFRPKQLPVAELVRRLQPNMERAIAAFRKLEAIEATRRPGDRRRTLIGMAPNAALGKRIEEDEEAEVFVFGEDPSATEDPFR